MGSNQGYSFLLLVFYIVLKIVLQVSVSLGSSRKVDEFFELTGDVGQELEFVDKLNLSVYW